MKTIKNILISSVVLCTGIIQGCVSETAYYAHESADGSFSMNDKYLRVDSFDYPIFSMKENRDAPLNLNFQVVRSGQYKHPDLLKKYKWQITHAFNGRYLAYSKEYDYQYCLANMRLEKSSPKRCADNYPGHSYNIHIYVNHKGEAYGFQFLRNPKRWLFPSDKVSWFRILDYGDWSGQPWFECVDRCEKLNNMKGE